MDNLLAHLPDRQLSDYLLGQLPDDAQQAVEDHLAECPECEARAAEATPSDALVDLLHRAAVNSPSATVFSAFGNTLSSRLDSTPGDHPNTVFSDGFLAGANVGPPAALTGHSRYRVLRLLGYGGMGSVWLAEHLVMGRPVALKIIRPELLAKNGTLERFRREVQAAAKLNHPHIAHAYDAEQIGDSHFLVMEYVPGHTLSERVKAGPLPITAACQAIRDAALGLAHAHAAGLVHRDVKPGNLIQTEDGMVKVLDFGLAISAEADSSITGENLVMGTPDYVAPEQAEDPHAADARSDIYSLGCTLYHLLSGRVPFTEDSMVKKIDSQRFRDPEPIADLPQSLWLIVAKMMAKQPAQRFQTALEVAETLEPFCDNVALSLRDRDAECRATSDELAASERRNTLGFPIAERQGYKRTSIVVLGIFALLLGVVVYRIQTDKGEIVITADEDAEISVKQGGKEITVYDTKTKQKLILNSGTYELELRGKPTGLKLDIEKATIKRGDTFLAKVERFTKPAAEAPQDTAKTSTAVENSGEARLMLDPHAPKLKLVRTHHWPERHIYASRVSPKGKYYAAGGDVSVGQGIQVWETATGQVVAHFPGSVAMEFSHDEKVFFTSPDGLVIRGWDLSSKAQIHEFLGHTKEVVSDLVLTHDSQILVSTGKDQIVRFWDMKSDQQIGMIEAPENHYPNLSPTPDGKRLMVYDVYGIDPEFRLMDIASRNVIRRWKNSEESYVDVLKISGDGQRFLTVQGQYRTLYLWSMESDVPTRQWRLPSNCSGAAVSNDLQWLLLGTNGNTVNSAVYLFNLATDKVRGRHEIAHGAMGEYAFTPDGRFAVFATTGPSTVYVFEMPQEVWKK